jgi:hypothetical protein
LPTLADHRLRRALHAVAPFRDLSLARLRADSAEEDAASAVDDAYAAINEAEYAVLDPELARVEANELAESSGDS